MAFTAESYNGAEIGTVASPRIRRRRGIRWEGARPGLGGTDGPGRAPGLSAERRRHRVDAVGLVVAHEDARTAARGRDGEALALTRQRDGDRLQDRAGAVQHGDRVVGVVEDLVTG